MDRAEETDCRLFYGYVCRLNLGKNHIWDHCNKFEQRTKKNPPRTATLIDQ